MANETAAPAHIDQMRLWVALGGGNSGIIGNAAHRYGFHRGAIAVPATDYSRRHDPRGADGPFSGGGAYACAGDYWHGGKAALRARHAVLLTRLMDGDPDLSTVCEMIGQPWADKPVYYWAVWNGRRKLQAYTGSGHTQWSHVSVWRSDAVRAPALWTPSTAAHPGTAVPVKRTESTKVLRPPAWRTRRPNYFKASRKAPAEPLVRAWQARMRQRGWDIAVTGRYTPASARVARQFQIEKHLDVDELLGPQTFGTAWTAPVTR